MSDASSGSTIPPADGPPAGGTPPPGGQSAPPPHPPFPAARLVYAIGYGIIAWFVIHVVFLLAVIQFVVIAINGRGNDELKHFCLVLVQYLWELLAFITFVRDEQPFPLGPFPKHA
jgi:Domain of unknown function (DUF4389)